MADRLGIEEATGAQGTTELPSIWILSCDWRLHLAFHCSCYGLQMFLLQPRCCGCGFHRHCLRPHQGQEQQSPFSYIFSCQCLSQATSTGNSWLESFGKCRAVPVSASLLPERNPKDSRNSGSDAGIPLHEAHPVPLHTWAIWLRRLCLGF